jgi:hypothetical protein
MKYALGVDGVIGETVTGFPSAFGLVSFPVSPSYGCPAGETFPALV